MLIAAFVAQVLAAVSAVMLARRRTSHVPAAVALVLLATVSILHAPILAALRPLPRPIAGGARVLIYMDTALSFATSAIVAGLAVAVAVSPERRRVATGAVLGVWLLGSVVMSAIYPSPLVRGQGLQSVYFDADLIALLVATLALITEARADMAAERSPTAASMLAWALLLFDGGILLAPFSPWRTGLFTSDFGGVQFMLAGSFTIIAIVQVILWRFSGS